MLPNTGSSTHLKCYPTKAPFWALGGFHEQAVEAHIHEDDSFALSPLQPGPEESHPGRVLQDLRLSSQACDSPLEPTLAGLRARQALGGTTNALRRRGGQSVGGRLGSLSFPVVGTSESGAAGLDALGQEALPTHGRSRKAAARHQPGDDRSAPGGCQTSPSPQDLWHDQTRNPAQTHDPHPDRSLGRAQARVSGNRHRSSLWDHDRRTLCVDPGHRGLRHDLDRAPGDPRQRREGGGRGPDRDRGGTALPRAGLGLRFRRRVYQLFAVAFLSGSKDSLYAQPPVQEKRQRAHRAEELDPCAQALRLQPLRIGGGMRCDERPLSQRTAALPKCLSAIGQALKESPPRRASDARLRQAQDTLATGASLKIRRSKESQRTATPDPGTRSLHTFRCHRQEARRDSAPRRNGPSSKTDVSSGLGTQENQRHRHAGGDSKQHSGTHDQRRQYDAQSLTKKLTKGALPANNLTMNFGNISYELTNHPSVTF